MVLCVILGHPSPPQTAQIESSVWKQLLEDFFLARFSEPWGAGRFLLPWSIHLRKILDKSLLSREGASRWFRSFPQSLKPAWSYPKCKDGEEAAENYWAWGKEWTLAMLTSIMKANGMIYVFQKWLFGKICCSAALGPNWHLSCIIKYHLRETSVHDLTEK